jgi:hypothetical protein
MRPMHLCCGTEALGPPDVTRSDTIAAIIDAACLRRQQLRLRRRRIWLLRADTGLAPPFEKARQHCGRPAD